MRSFAKALPCLLFCVACVTLAPAVASASVAPPPGPHAAGHGPAHGPAIGRHAHFDMGAAVARRRTKAHRPAPKLVQAAPHDTSNRFLMTQNGRQMTADDFDAWMKARGFRVAKGAPEAARAAD
ncbi:MAG TPA: hypothetical protein VLM17_05885 [Xanthomonadaceae bacterium]|nr:hypothetical protein [Xanthomonadaceae bacterium]